MVLFGGGGAAVLVGSLLGISPDHSSSVTQAGLGDKVIVRSGPWVCGSTVSAFDELTRWAVLRDEEEVARTLVRTGSAMISPGSTVKILDLGFVRTKVRVPSGLECWVAAEAVRASAPENCRDPHERVGTSGVCFCEEPYHTDPTTFKCVK
jgi:hypothetical protein